jgi:CBS domain-containing protein
MLRRNTAQAAEDGPAIKRSRRLKKTPRRWNAAPTLNITFVPCAAGVDPGAHLEGREATMTVGIILAAKGRDVVTIEPGASLAHAVGLLAEKRIGAALILGADHRIAGIISERDIVRALAAGGAAALNEPVSQTMTRKVETCNENETVASIMERMTAGKFRHMPVVDQGRLVGVVSIGDIVKHRVFEMERDSVALRDYIMTA